MSYCWNCRNFSICTNRGFAWNSGKDCKERDEVLVITKAFDSNGNQVGHSVVLDKSTQYGMLRCSQEMDVSFSIDNGKLDFLGCWEIRCGEACVWEKEEESVFTEFYPGLLKEVENAINNGNVRFI